MKVQIGLELCTSGYAEKISSHGKQSVKKGTLMVISPLFPTLETARSADYETVALYEDMDRILPLITQHQPSAQTLAAISPFLSLDKEQCRQLIAKLEQIKLKERQVIDAQHPIEQHVKESIVGLCKQQVMLEYALLFFLQMPQGDAEISHKRQVLVRFMVSVNQHFAEHRSVSYYAEQEHMTPRQFADIIRQESGYTPIEWIGMVTINQAKNLLRLPEKQVKEVAAELGFPEQFTFRKYFKTHTGISPSEFRHQSME